MSTNIEIDDGILIQKNFLSKQKCEEAIDYFEKCNKFGFALSRPELAHDKNDKSIMLMDSDLITRNFKAQWQVFGYLSEHLAESFYEYTEKYTILKENSFQIYDYKIQKTVVGGGYHIWHDDGLKDTRAVVVLIYLNDVEEGGETEFLYKRKRVTSEQGKLLMFPANYMWTHRGNPPISNDKYIMTGWIQYV